MGNRTANRCNNLINKLARENHCDIEYCLLLITQSFIFRHSLDEKIPGLRNFTALFFINSTRGALHGTVAGKNVNEKKRKKKKGEIKQFDLRKDTYGLK